MKHFTIDKANNITFHASHREAKETGGGFRCEVQKAGDSDKWGLLEL